MVTEGKWTVGDGNEDASNPRDKIQARSQDIDIIRAHDIHEHYGWYATKNIANRKRQKTRQQNHQKHTENEHPRSPPPPTLRIHTTQTPN